VVVASAGNSANSADPHIGVPAEANNVLAIGAVKADRSYASFSSIGPSFDLRVKPDVMAQGQSSVLSNTAGSIVTASGTSFSCPIIAGMIACFWQAIPWATNAQIVQFVKQAADRFLTPDNLFGYGIPDFQLALNIANLSMPQNTKNSFELYPNPISSNLTLSFPNETNKAQVVFYNALGQVVFEKTILNSLSTISLDDLQPGIYFYKIQSSSMTQTGKIIKE
jgi:subtilisin family serine protease